jgi:hypothetical protein
MMLRLLPLRLLRLSQWRNARRQQVAPGAVDRFFQCVAIVGQQRQQAGDVGRVPMAVQIGFGQADVAAGQHPAEHRFVMHLQRDAVFAIAEQGAAAIRQADFEQAAAQLFKQRKQAGVAGRFPAAAQDHRVVHLR